jgi:hypothetical protein
MNSLYESENFDYDVLDGISTRDITDFIDSRVWNAIVKDLEKRLEHADMLLESAPVEDIRGIDENGKEVLLRIGIKKLQGACMELRYLLELPNAFKTILEEREKETRNE